MNLHLNFKMSKDYQNVFLIFFAALSLIFLASFQVSVINRFNWGFNIFLVLILLLTLTKNIYSAVFLGWLGGFLVDTVRFSTFGTTSLLLLFITVFLIIKKEPFIFNVKLNYDPKLII